MTAPLVFIVDDEASVFAASVYYHLAQYIPVTLTGLIYLNTAGFKLADVEAVAESESAKASVEA